MLLGLVTLAACDRAERRLSVLGRPREERCLRHRELDRYVTPGRDVHCEGVRVVRIPLHDLLSFCSVCGHSIFAVHQATPLDDALVIGCAARSITYVPQALQSGRGTVYNHVMTKHVIHISDAEAASDFASVLDRVREGAEVVIEHDARPVAVVRPAEPHVRLLSESLRLAREHASTATLDGDFARDLEEVINSHREPLNPPAWD